MTPYWHRNYRRRHPLTQSFARSLHEIDDEKYQSWFEGPEPGEGARFGLAEALRWIVGLGFLLSLFFAPHMWRAITG